MGYVFISYSSEHTDEALALSNVLKSKGIDTWIACEDIAAGSDFSVEIPKAVRGCSAFLLLLTPEALESEPIRSELSLAMKYKKTRFMIQLDRNIQWNDSIRFFYNNAQATFPQEISGEDGEMQKLIADIWNVMVGRDRHTSPSEDSAKKSPYVWWIIAGVVVALALAVALLLGGSDEPGTNNNGSPMGGNVNTTTQSIADANATTTQSPTVADTTTIQTPSTTQPTNENDSLMDSEYNEIPSIHQSEVEAFCMDESNKYSYFCSKTVKVGDAVKVDGWSGSKIYSMDTRIAKQYKDTLSVEGISPGDVIVVVESSVSSTMRKVYWIHVVE